MKMNSITPVVTPAWLRDRLEDEDICVVDCRFALGNPDLGQQQYAQSHIPGAYYLDLNEDLASPVQRHGGRHPLPEIATLAATLSTMGVRSHKTGRPTHVIAYDDSQFAFAARLWWLLRYLGHDQVSVLDGGWSAWQALAYPVSIVLPEPQPGLFTPQVHAQWVVDRETLQMRLAQAPPLLVDSRSPERYRGEVEPIDPIAGHIPGAVNLFWQTVTDANGYAKSPSDQQQRWQTLASTAPEEEVIIYCGSGVTACVNVLSRAIAGLPLGQLYPGSWSDWCSYLVDES